MPEGRRYNVRLDFAEISFNGPGQREFDVTINGIQVLTDFDIFATAGGWDVATAKNFTAIASTSGQILIQFNGVISGAWSTESW